MAALVSHAMRRYPLSPPDGVFSFNLRNDSTPWSPAQEEGESALSRSMRYADPWLYGSVRGAPPGALVLTPAFVLCSCSDYLNGTKRNGSKKGPTICKKCKGTRVALAQGNGETKFGTVRCYSSTTTSSLQSVSTSTPMRAGTVRVTSSSRPSILPATPDPYDLMRRSRLNSSSEVTSPLRVRSVSPNKRNNVLTSSGRRSILECNINPYELMSTESDQPAQDSSITFVNGQRIRVRPQAPEPDYEDVEENQSPKKFQPDHQTKNPSTFTAENAAKSSRSKPNRIAPDPPPVSQLGKDQDRNSPFKSILKKSTRSSDSKMLTYSGRSKAGSHFYLPMPNSSRKKVQFLVEHSENGDETTECGVGEVVPDYDQDQADQEMQEKESVVDVSEEEESSNSEDNDSRMCTLRRSTSERFKVEPQKVVFLDTMAIRVKQPRGDSRETFNNCDLQKLDGLIPKRKLSPRPKEPPPLPPPKDQGHCDVSSEDQLTSNEICAEFDQPLLVSPMRRESIKKKQKINTEANIENKEAEGTENIKENIENEQTKEQNANSSLTENTDNPFSMQNETQLIANNEFPDHALVSVDCKENAIQKSSSMPETESTNEEPTFKADIKEIRNKFENPTEQIPQAPPRKRSNNKQPGLNVQIVTDSWNNEKHRKILTEDDEAETKVTQDSPCTENSKDISIPITTENLAQGKNSYLKNNTSENIDCDENSPSTQIRDNSGSVSPSMDYSNKTVVKITPSSSPVHRIQIKNEFPETANIQTITISEHTQRKTSIMINGDDCYSTVNVNDDVPIYQSSVVVKGHGISENNLKNSRRSSSVYITGRFEEEDASKQKSFAEENNYKNEPHYCTCKNNSGEITKEKEEKQIPTENKTIKAVEKTEKNVDICIRPSTPDMLREILRDPVEAVKRNLVPHICGKSDLQRRPRDLKLKNYYPMIPLKETDVSCIKDNGAKEGSPLRPWNFDSLMEDDKDACSEHSSSTQYEFVDPGSDCYTDHSNRSSVTEEELSNRTKFYELLAESSLMEVSENEDHHYECINRHDNDPIYEEIEIPPPLPSNPPPISLLDDLKLDKEFTTRSIFEGASKYDILSYLVDAKERGIVPEDSYTFSSINGDYPKESSPKISHINSSSDLSEDNSLVISGSLTDDKIQFSKNSEIERNDSGVGSETSKSSLSKYRSKPVASSLCEDCETRLESLNDDDQMLCRKCLKKRSERKEIIMEIVETEEKYSKDLQIILEEFYQPMLVAGLLTPEQLSTIFLNVEELLENSQSLAERLRDAVEIALEQGDEDLLTVNIGKLFLEAAPMLHAFETYCVRQGPASLLLASLEKEKELLRIFLRVSQMENTLLRRMNLNSFLMVPVQRVTKYPLLLARLYKVTPNHNEVREQLKEAQHKIELHLNHMNSQTKDVPSKLWRRIGSSSGRRPSTEMDLVNIKLRKIAVDVLEWNHEEAKFALEGKLWFTQPTDNNWRKGRTIKLSPVNALLVTNGKLTNTNKPEREDNALIFPKHSPTREAALLLVRDKNGRYSLLRDPLYLDRCVIASDPAWQSYFEVQELLGKDTFIFKAEDEEQTRLWYQQLQFHAQGMGSWRKRRNALANIMMNGMGLRL
ncbi:uncharacterized protein LOC123311920 [Coccinella septempunctata]|uniref:uncharacterized protein LOC123311920 n=1 Tax=Coccinella septempunctata TaxID=41139 RepID=UPI001D06A33E|nr:uncharacterized protein LOC123311920 [Coccinella septempunctata]